jgi:tetratricopeptide (TPR) repeat protein
MKFCTQCGTSYEQTPNFCGNCGNRIQGGSKKLRLAPLVIFGVLGLGISFLVVQGSERLIGKAPTQAHLNHTAAQQSNPADQSDKVKELRAELAINANSLPNLRALAAELWNLLPNEGDPAPGLVLEIIDTLSKILVLDDKDGESLLMLANLTFNQKVFTKSSEYFQRYLTIHPDDLEARSSYASTLTFIGRPQDAIVELDKVLAQTPNAFQPLAFKAITLGQMDKLEEAKSIGTKALQYAPNDEARKRFQGFLDSLTGQRNQNSEPAVVTYLKTHQIVGPKFVSFSTAGDTATVILKEFPMSAMPPFAREKFDQALTSKLTTGSIKHVRLIDSATKEVLATY